MPVQKKILKLIEFTTNLYIKYVFELIFLYALIYGFVFIYLYVCTYVVIYKAFLCLDVAQIYMNGTRTCWWRFACLA